MIPSWKEWQNENGICEMKKFVEEFTIDLEDGLSPRITIRVYEYAHGGFVGISNYAIQGPGQGGPYRSLHGGRTVDEALYDALSGLMCYYPEDSEAREKVIWEKEETW